MPQTYMRAVGPGSVVLTCPADVSYNRRGTLFPGRPGTFWADHDRMLLTLSVRGDPSINTRDAHGIPTREIAEVIVDPLLVPGEKRGREGGVDPAVGQHMPDDQRSGVGVGLGGDRIAPVRGALDERKERGRLGVGAVHAVVDDHADTRGQRGLGGPLAVPGPEPDLGGIGDEIGRAHV